MRKVLVPTDFSETAANAIRYAAEFAKHTNASLVVFHAYHVPIIVSEAPFVTTMEDLQLEENCKNQLELIKKDILEQYQAAFPVEILSSPGLASDEIPFIAKENNCDLIIMGTNGKRGVMGSWGSNTVNVIKHTECDVLVIPAETRFLTINKIVFAFDYVTVESQSVFDTLLDITNVFSSEILIFNMEDSRVPHALEKEIQGMQLENILKEIKHSYWFSDHQDIVVSINNFTENNQAVLVAMIRRNHSLFQQIFSKSSTRQMALNTHFPLLILHEKK